MELAILRVMHVTLLLYASLDIGTSLGIVVTLLTGIYLWVLVEDKFFY